MKKMIMVVLAVICGWACWAADPVANVVAKQSSLGSGLVEITFDLIPNKSTTSVTVSAMDAAKGTALSVKTLQDASGNKLSNPCTLAAGIGRKIQWNALADLGKGFYSSSVSISIKAEMDTTAPADGLYCVIDISGGPTAEYYPVTYLDKAPTEWPAEYKTTKIVLRKINAGTFQFDRGGGNPVKTTLTKPFYIGVFEVTGKQYELVTGIAKDAPSNPVSVPYTEIRGGYKGMLWPYTHEVDDLSFVGRLRMRTGMDIDLPTEAQWEYSAKAGTSKISGDETANAYGLYGMLSEYGELCVDRTIGSDYMGGVDPVGELVSHCGGGSNLETAYVVARGYNDDDVKWRGERRSTGVYSWYNENFRIVGRLP